MRWPAALLLLALPACGLYDGLTAAAGPSSPAPADCRACHVEQAAEWEASAHARAWTSETFAAASGGRQFGECQGCHAPASLHEAPGAPLARAERREHGVDCQACHLDHGQLAGPLERGALAEPHPVRVDAALFRSPALCGRCHEGSHREWLEHAAPDERTCQECHMPAVTRTVTAATGALSSLLVAFEPQVPQRRHTFDLSALVGFEDAVAVAARARRGPGGVEVSLELTNLLPHLLPTGDFARHAVRLEVLGRGADGRVVGRAELLFRKELGTALVPDVAHVTSAALPAGARTVELRLERLGRPDEAPLLLHRGEVTVP